MKQFLLGLSISGAFILGCVTATVAQSSSVPVAGAAAPAGVQRWEYQCDTSAFGKAGYVKKLNEAGAAGWELVTDGCLKRPL